MIPSSPQFKLTPSIHPQSAEARTQILENPGFGRHFTDHMVRVHWDKATGWHDAAVVPYGPIALDPAAAVLHYGQEVFEGIKAYRHADGSVWTFRPTANAKRMQRSAKRLALPELPVDIFVESLKQIIAVDKDWVPGGAEASLYLRPFVIGTEVFLGVRSAHKASYYVIASPSGPYFENGIAPVAIWLSTDFARAAKGGTGAAKCGGNYAASMLPQEQAYQNGCSQVLFLDPVEGKYLEELGGMNLFLVYGKENKLVTPALSGSILEGITRDSILQLARDRGMTVEERKIAIDEWKNGVASGAITEVFACGTAAVITPISQLKAADFSIGTSNATAGSVTLSLRKELTDIQYGRAPDRHGWMLRLDA